MGALIFSKTACMILAIGVFHGSFSDSDGLPILWMSFSKVSMMTDDYMSRNFLVIQWLGLSTSTAVGPS